jgi:hypothetical protein
LTLFTVTLAFLLQTSAVEASPSSPANVAVVTEKASTEKAETERALDELRVELDKQRRAFERQEALLREEIAALKLELSRALDERIAREREWLRYSKALQGARPEGLRFDPVVPAEASQDASAEEAGDVAGSVEPATSPTTSPAAVPDPSHGEGPPAGEAAATTGAVRGREVLIALRSLFMTEEIIGLDLLEIGNVGDSWTGPVVMRVLGEWGRPLGSITAERLRLEGSRAALTLTLVLEEGYERRMGERIPFEGPGGENVRRIVLPHVDPGPWMKDLPELFDENSLLPPPDDGHWDLGGVRASLNELLRLDAANGYYRVRVLGGVQGDLLRNVMLEHLDPDGRLERRLFADRIEVVPQDRGLMLLLEGGAQERGGRKTPFLEGRYRIFLPRAELARWTEAGVPGLSERPPLRTRSDARSGSRSGARR